jgi:type IV secretory pathway VirD2 relaxase
LLSALAIKNGLFEVFSKANERMAAAVLVHAKVLAQFDIVQQVRAKDHSSEQLRDEMKALEKL